MKYNKKLRRFLHKKAEPYVIKNRYAFIIIFALSVLFILITRVKYLNMIFNPLISYTIVLLAAIIMLKLKGNFILKTIPFYIVGILFFTLLDSTWQLDFLGSATFITLIVGVILAIFQ